MGSFKLGNLVRFVPVSIITGFTAGIAVIIALSQLKDLLGLTMERVPANFFSQVAALLQSLHSVNLWAVVISASSLLLIVIWPVSYAQNTSRWRRVTAKLPSTLIVLLVWSVAVWALHLPVETIGSKFGDLPAGLPMPTIPAFDWPTAQNLVAPTLAIAILCAIEALLCARMADSMIQDRHDPNQELMAQGVANFVTPWFGGIAATGTIARTVTNIRAGARSPIAGIVHALTLLLVVLFAAPFAKHIPLAALAAILWWVAYSMGDWKEFAKLKQYSVFYRTTLLTTFALTVAFDLVVAVEVGLVLSSLFFIYRISSLTKVEEIDLAGFGITQSTGRSIGAYRLFGSLFFGSVTKLEHLLDPQRSLPDVVILEMHQVINLDTTGLDALESLHLLIQRRGGRLILAGLNEQPLSLVSRSHFNDALGAQNLAPDLQTALQRARVDTAADAWDGAAR
jgi:SulP family sulfate permease